MNKAAQRHPQALFAHSEPFSLKIQNENVVEEESIAGQRINMLAFIEIRQALITVEPRL